MADGTKPARVALARRPELGKLLLRAGDDVAKLAASALQRPWPTGINSASGRTDDRTLRLGPDEYLLIVPRPAVAELLDRLGPALAGHHHARVDLSARFAVLEIQGAAVCPTLAAACPLDLHETVLGTDAATRTVLGKAEIILDRLAADHFRLIVDRTHAPYAEALLREAGREFGVASKPLMGSGLF